MVKIEKNNSEKIDLRHEITSQFRIKIYSNNDAGKTFNKLLGYSGLLNIIGEELSHKFMINSLVSENQINTYKLRRGLTIKFYSK